MVKAVVGHEKDITYWLLQAAGPRAGTVQNKKVNK